MRGTGLSFCRTATIPLRVLAATPDGFLTDKHILRTARSRSGRSVFADPYLCSTLENRDDSERHD
jgi:hypothetical protein